MIPAMDPRYPTGKFAYDPNPTAASRRAAVDAIGAFPGELKAALGASELDKPYRDGGWTARQVVHHLADSHMNAFIRFRLALTEDNPTVKPYNEAEWSKLVDAQLDPQLSVQILDGLHQRWHRMLEAMSENDFARTAVHPDHGPITVDWLLQLYAWHGRHHIGHLKLTGA
jgi:hypothetical protein